MPTLNSYDYAIVRIVPDVEREEFVNAGVILICRTCPFIAARVALNRARLLALAPDVDVADVEQQLLQIPLIAAGDPSGGPIAKLTPTERFHWLVAPRSTVIQVSPVHSGLCENPRDALDHLMESMVLA